MFINVTHDYTFSVKTKKNTVRVRKTVTIARINNFGVDDKNTWFRNTIPGYTSRSFKVKLIIHTWDPLPVFSSYPILSDSVIYSYLRPSHCYSLIPVTLSLLLTHT